MIPLLLNYLDENITLSLLMKIPVHKWKRYWWKNYCECGSGIDENHRV